MCNIVHTPDIPEDTKSSVIIIPEEVITTIGWKSRNPHVLITALVVLVYEKIYTPDYYGGLSIPDGAVHEIKRKFKKGQLKRAYDRLVELGILKKEGKELIIPWL